MQALPKVSNTTENIMKGLLAIGGVNWGLSIFNFNLVSYLSGLMNLPVLSTIVYSAIGLTGAYVLFTFKNKI